MHIVDRRLNPSGKNLANRQRFMRRAKAQIRKAVHESAGSRSIKDADEGGEVVLPAQGVHEPSFRRSGSRRHSRPSAARQQGIHRRRHDPAAAPGRRRIGVGRQPGRGGRGRFPLRPVARRIRRPVPGRPGTSRPGQAPGGERRGHGLSPSGLFGDGVAGQSGAEPDGAEFPVPPHRAAPAEARGAAGAARRDRSARGRTAGTKPASSRWRRNMRARSAAPG